MNRILIDEVIDNNSKDIVYDIKNEQKIYITDTDKNIILNIKKDTNLLIELFDGKKLNINLNIYSNVCLNIISYKGINEDITINLNKEKSSINVYNSVISESNNKIKVLVNHNKSNTLSNIYNCGVTKNNGSLNMEIVSKVGKKIKDCSVNQDSKIISLNNTNDNVIKPILLIDNYETEAKHSAFIGKFNEEEVFYLESRGLNRKTAYNLLLNAFLIGIMQIDEEEKEMIKQKINK